MDQNMIIHWKRLKCLLRKDWMEHKRGLAITLGCFLGLYALIILFYAIGNGMLRPYPFFMLGLLATWILFCHYVGRCVHRPDGLSLTQPANTSERFAAFCLEGIGSALAYVGLFWVGLEIARLLVCTNGMRLSDILPNLPFFPFLVFLASLMLLAYVTFRRFALPIALGGYVVLLSTLIVVLLRGVLQFASFDLGDPPYREFQPEFRALSWLSHAFAPGFYLFTLAVLYIIYCKLKEKEAR